MTKGQHNALIVRREESVRTMGKDYLVALLLLLIVPTVYPMKNTLAKAIRNCPK